MTSAKLFFHAIFINSFLVAAISCSQATPNNDRTARFHYCSQAIARYNNLEESRLYTSEGETATAFVQSSLQAIINHNDASGYSYTLRHAIHEQATTDDLLDTNKLKTIAKILTPKHQNNIS